MFSKSDQIPILQNWWISILGRLWILRFFLFFFLHQYWYWVLNVPLGTERTLQTEVPFMLLILDDWEPILKYVKNELISILTYDRVTVFFTLRKKELISILTHVRKTANLKCARWRKKWWVFCLAIYIESATKIKWWFFLFKYIYWIWDSPPFPKNLGYIYSQKKLVVQSNFKEEEVRHSGSHGPSMLSHPTTLLSWFKPRIWRKLCRVRV